MAKQRFKAPLNVAKFPFLYSRVSRAVLQQNLDLAPRTPQAFYGNLESADFNTLSLIYAENVFPIATGILSVGIKEEIQAFSPPVTDFDQLLTLRDSDENNVLFCPGRGKNYVYNSSSLSWESKNPFSWNPIYALVSKAYVNGNTFVCYESARVIRWNAATVSFDTITLTLPAGYAMLDIRGISGASNYLLAFTAVDILWSSLTNNTNFNDPVGGSGRQIPQDLKGPITNIQPMAGGFIIYTTRNAVAAFFTNNPATPFLFKEIIGSGGVGGSNQVTGDANAAGHFTYGSSGLQLVSMQRAESVFPEASDFLVSREYESWNKDTGQVESTNLVAIQEARLVMLANRFLFISYGWTGSFYTFALVYDLSLQRWGKLRINHVDCGLLPLEAGGGKLRYYQLGKYSSYAGFGYDELVAAYGSVPPLKSGFVFLEPSGRTQIILIDSQIETSNGVAVFGRVQVTRNRKVTFQRADVDGLFSVPAPSLKLLPSENGYDRSAVVVAVPVSQSTRSVRYDARYTAENFDIAIEGRFDLSTLVIETMVHGTR
jgi:hypothetical protein